MQRSSIVLAALLHRVARLRHAGVVGIVVPIHRVLARITARARLLKTSVLTQVPRLALREVSIGRSGFGRLVLASLLHRIVVGLAFLLRRLNLFGDMIV